MSDGEPLRYFRVPPDDARRYAADRDRLRHASDGTEVLDFAEAHATKRVVSLLDVLQRRADGWAADADGNGEDPQPYRDMAEYVRNLVQEFGGEEKPC